MLRVIGVYLFRKNFRYLYLLGILVVIVAIYAQNVEDFRLARLTTKICIHVDKDSIKARHKSCFLRPDTGPCRADIVQFYFDAMHATCFRFFWGGCQGNGNRFETKEQCLQYCILNATGDDRHVPHFCTLAFDFGTCYGHYNRWAWDQFAKTCKRRLYSGCGGNQNNFESRKECMANCLNPPNNTIHKVHKHTTCIPFNIEDQR